MNKQTIINIAFALAITPTLLAQNLREEVVIEREIVPVERTAIRPTWVTANVLAPQVDSKPLSFNEYVQTAEISRSLPPLEAVSWADSVMRTPYKGYASLGYFPAYNLGISAGYRFLKNEKMNVGAHASFDGSSWKGWEGYDDSYKRNQFTIGADGKFVFDPGTLSANLKYAWSGTDMAHTPGIYERGGQGINMLGIDVKWKPAKTDRIGWDLRAAFGFGGFTNNKTEKLSFLTENVAPAFDFAPVKDVTFGLSSDLSYGLGEKNSIDLGVGLDIRYIDKFNCLTPQKIIYIGMPDYFTTVVPEALGSRTLGIISLKPAYKFVSGNISGHVGVRVDFNTGGEQKDVHFAPDINVQWAFMPEFSAYLKAIGGEVMNTNTALWNRNPWMTGVFTMERSHVNADVELGLNYGSHKSFWGTLFVGWSSVSNWVNPVVMENVNTWARMNEFNGFNFGLELGYAWKDMIRVVGHVKGAQHCKYYRWQDNASCVFDIAVKGRPIPKLQVELGYEGRVGRRGYIVHAESTPTSNAYLVSSTISLGNTSNLFLGAEYEITSALSAFVKCENLLNQHWNLTSFVRSPGVHGLLGVQYKF